jgi:hypothetical protein
MIAIIIAIDQVSNRHLKDLFSQITSKYPYFFLIEHVGQGRYSTGALFNVGVRLAGLPDTFNIQFFNFCCNFWTKSDICTCLEFKRTNGYNNYEPRANVLNINEWKGNGYDQVYASNVGDLQYSPNFFHYKVQLEEDKVLNLGTIFDDINVPININNV